MIQQEDSKQELVASKTQGIMSMMKPSVATSTNITTTTTAGLGQARLSNKQAHQTYLEQIRIVKDQRQKTNKSIKPIKSEKQDKSIKHDKQQQDKASKERQRRSRSRSALKAAAEKAKVNALLVQQGLCAPPKRNQVFLLDPEAIGLEQLGRFWFSRDPDSWYYMSPAALKVFKPLVGAFDSDEVIREFHYRRSLSDGDEDYTQQPSLRSLESFFIFHCKRHRVIRENTESGALVDVASDYQAMLSRYTKSYFDSFCRNKVVVFDAPDAADAADAADATDVTGLADKDAKDPQQAHPAQQPQQIHNDAYQEVKKVQNVGEVQEAEGVQEIQRVRGLRRMLCTTVAQLNFFHWMFEKQLFDIISGDHEVLHRQAREAVKAHARQKKGTSMRPGRMSLTSAFSGAFAVSRDMTVTTGGRRRSSSSLALPKKSTFASASNTAMQGTSTDCTLALNNAVHSTSIHDADIGKDSDIAAKAGEADDVDDDVADDQALITQRSVNVEPQSCNT